MNKILLFFILLPSWLTAQKILLVNDNDFITRNSDTLIKDLIRLDLDFDVFDIESNGGNAPEFSEMDQYDMVIWYTSSDQDGLTFWQSITETNIRKIIDKGKIFWVVGLDFIADKYGSPPIDFSEVDVLYNYFGIKKYAYQSYEDDDFQGCSQLDKAPNAFDEFSNNIFWSLPNVWWIDGCEILPLSKPIYNMGPTSYKLAGSHTMFSYFNGKKKTMTTLFDPSAIDKEANRLKFLKASINNLKLLANNNDVIKSEIAIYPNPFYNKIEIHSDEKIEEISIINAFGIELSKEKFNNDIDVSHLSQGNYFIKFILADKIPVIKKISKL